MYVYRSKRMSPLGRLFSSREKREKSVTKGGNTKRRKSGNTNKMTYKIFSNRIIFVFLFVVIIFS